MKTIIAIETEPGPKKGGERQRTRYKGEGRHPYSVNFFTPLMQVCPPSYAFLYVCAFGFCLHDMIQLMRLDHCSIQSSSNKIYRCIRSSNCRMLLPRKTDTKEKSKGLTARLVYIWSYVYVSEICERYGGRGGVLRM